MRPKERTDRTGTPASSTSGARRSSSHYASSAATSAPSHAQMTMAGSSSGQVDASDPYSYGAPMLQSYNGHQPPSSHSQTLQPQHHAASTYGGGYVTQPSYMHYPPPSSPPAIHQPFSAPMGDVLDSLPYGSMPPDAPARAVSPNRSQTNDPTSAEPYYNPYHSGAASNGQHFYTPSGLPDSTSGYPQSQYPQHMYGMQYFAPSYAQQPAYYGPAQPSVGWMGTAPQVQQGWRPAPYYPYGNQQPGFHSYGRPTAMARPRMPSGSQSVGAPSGSGNAVTSTSTYLQGKTTVRSVSSSSRTSPNSIANLSSSQHHKVASSSSSFGPAAESEGNAALHPASGASNTRTTPASQSHQGQGPRSEFVLWCGNVPADATTDECWSFFAKPGEKKSNERALVQGPDLTVVNDEEDDEGDEAALTDNGYQGVLSIFIISRSNCAFVNYDTSDNLRRALKYFQGQSLRPHDPRCPKLVCRVRKKDDEAQAGVAGQRGRGIHVAWLKEQERKAREDMRVDSVSEPLSTDEIEVLSPTLAATNDPGLAAEPPSHAALLSVSPHPASPSPANSTPTPQNHSSLTPRPSIDHSSSGSGSVSYASTNSSLFRHPAFRERFFILKSLRVEDLDKSVESGLWATQVHNEAVLDQAYRNSESVYLIFSANQSGGFYGYARMASAINPAPASAGAADRGTSIVLRPTSIPEHEHEDDTGGSGIDNQLSMPVTGLSAATASPLQLTPSGDIDETTLFRDRSQSVSSVPGSVPASVQPESRPRTQNTLTPATVPPVAIVSAAPDNSVRLNQTRLFEQRDETLAGMLVVSPREELSEDPLQMGRVRSAERSSLGSASSEPIRKAVGMQSPPSSDGASLAPSESASYPADTRSQGQLAIRALIHNLRLDEKESVHRARQLEAIEAEMREKEAAGASNEEVERTSQRSPQPLATSPDTWGKSFKVEWIKVQSLDFQRVRRLRNPWRDNRQVKVSRDGTELEPNVGRQMLEEWNKTDSQAKNESPPSNSVRVGPTYANLEEEEEEHVT